MVIYAKSNFNTFRYSYLFYVCQMLFFLSLCLLQTFDHNTKSFHLTTCIHLDDLYPPDLTEVTGSKVKIINPGAWHSFQHSPPLLDLPLCTHISIHLYENFMTKVDKWGHRCTIDTFLVRLIFITSETYILQYT